MVKVFISHSSVDTWVARQLATHIKGCGADTFLDAADIEHGDDFEDRILEAEATCSELLVLLTPWAIGRTYVWLEIGFFKHSRKRIVGVLHGLSVEEITKDPHVAVLLKKLDLVDLNNVDSYFEQLKRRVLADAGNSSVA